jgi:hypothetical protein
VDYQSTAAFIAVGAAALKYCKEFDSDKSHDIDSQIAFKVICKTNGIFKNPLMLSIRINSYTEILPFLETILPMSPEGLRICWIFFLSVTGSVTITDRLDSKIVKG